MTPEQFDKLREIRKLLAEAYKDYFDRSDGYCKSSEGAVEVLYPTIFEYGEKLLAGDDRQEASGIGIYSYVLGPSRKHYWFRDDDNPRKGDADKWVRGCPFEAALNDVRQWHAEQLAWKPED